MANQNVTRAVLVDPTTLVASSQVPLQLALFNADGTAKTLTTKMTAQADTVAADLAALKVDFNALLAKMRTAGLMA